MLSDSSIPSPCYPVAFFAIDMQGRVDMGGGARLIDLKKHACAFLRGMTEEFQAEPHHAVKRVEHMITPGTTGEKDVFSAGFELLQMENAIVEFLLNRTIGGEYS